MESSEHLVLCTLLSHITLLVQVFCTFSILTISYTNLGFNLSFLKLLVPISDNCRPISHHTILCIFHYSPFLTKEIILEMFLVCLVVLPFLVIHTSDLLYNIITFSCYVTTCGSLSISSLFIILKCDIAITAVHALLYSLSALYWKTRPGACV